PARPLARAAAWLHAEGRAVFKRARARIPGNRNSADYQRHRFPGVTEETLRASAARFGALLGRFAGVTIRERAPDVFDVRPPRRAAER
ncbi:MAG: hypothetical protein KC560_10100, partial [Myxococcales bacterium]|nr:hypothetical protein [Myxococcales bacterium]